MANNNYDEAFLARFAFHFARTGSVPLCLPLLRAEFPHMAEFNKHDLNQLRGRLRRKTGEDIFAQERMKYLEEVGELTDMTPVDNIRNGKQAIDSGIEILVSKLNKCNEMIEISEPMTKEFNILLMTQSKLMELISKFSGIDDAMAVKRAHALSFLKQGKIDEANEAITGVRKPQEDTTPKIMDGEYEDDDEIEI